MNGTVIENYIYLIRLNGILYLSRRVPSFIKILRDMKLREISIKKWSQAEAEKPVEALSDRHERFWDYPVRIEKS